MSNAGYYRFERHLIQIITGADAETLRGALAGAVRHCGDANFNRSLCELLRANALPESDLRKALDATEVS